MAYSKRCTPRRSQNACVGRKESDRDERDEDGNVDPLGKRQVGVEPGDVDPSLEEVVEAQKGRGQERRVPGPRDQRARRPPRLWNIISPAVSASTSPIVSSPTGVRNANSAWLC